MSRQQRKRRPPRPYYKTNWAIRAQEIRLLDAQGKQIGILPIEEARKMAREQELDLIEIIEKAKPPIVKLIKFSKFKYLEKKKLKAKPKKSGGNLKEVRLTPFIGQKDLEIRLKRMKKFLTAGHKVKVSIKFIGRQVTKPEFGRKLIEKFQEELEGIAILEINPKLVHKRMYATFAPAKTTKSKKNKNEKSTPKT